MIENLREHVYHEMTGLDIAGHIDGVVEARRATSTGAEPTVLDSLLGDERLDAATITGIRVALFTAGQERSSGCLTNCLRYLAEHRDLQDRLRAYPTDIAAAIEEMLRLATPTTHSGRGVTRDVAIGGRQMRAGAEVMLMWPSGSRDEDTIAEADQVVVGRAPNPSLAFGYGIHLCVGAPFGRLELRVGLEEILARTASFELADTPARPTPRFRNFSFNHRRSVV